MGSATMERGYKLKDRPEFKTKPKPVTFNKKQTLAPFISNTSACLWL